MLDDLIAERSRKQDHGRRVARRLQLIARIVVVPAAAVMVLGLIWFAASTGGADGGAHSVVSLRAVFSRSVMTPIGAMSAGLLALALLPVINVLYILVDSLIVKRWTDAAAAAAVAGILILSMILGRA